MHNGRNQAVLEQAIAMGIDRLLPKPFEAGSLLELIGSGTSVAD